MLMPLLWRKKIADDREKSNATMLEQLELLQDKRAAGSKANQTSGSPK